MKTNKIKALEELLKIFEASELEIKDESASHANHYEADLKSKYPSHVKIFIVSKFFAGLSLLERQRLVNKALEPAFEDGLHAVSIKTNIP